MINTCLFLKPPVTSAEKQKQQKEDIEGYIMPAIERAGLSVLDDQVDGVEVDSDSLTSYDLIRSVYEADLLIVDVNCYETKETDGLFKLSPYLFYFIALGHSLGNHTILVTSSTAHLPSRLIEYHTLTYSSVYSVEGVKKFTNSFKKIVEDLRKDPIGWPDNPIQGYLKQLEAEAKDRARDAEVEEMRKIIEKQKAEAAKLKEMQQMIASQKLSNQSQPSIVFRKVK